MPTAAVGSPSSTPSVRHPSHSDRDGQARRAQPRGPCWCAANAAPPTGCLCRRHVRRDNALARAAELRELQVRFDSRRTFRLGIPPHRVVAALLARPAQRLEHPDPRQTLAAGPRLVDCKQRVQLVAPGAQPRHRLLLALVAELRRLRPENLTHGLARDVQLLVDLCAWSEVGRRRGGTVADQSSAFGNSLKIDTEHVRHRVSIGLDLVVPPFGP